MKAVSIGAVIWLLIVQWLASAFGGYLAGRMRTKWSGIHTHEVFFRDTANGFLTWALATLIVLVALSGATRALVGGAGQAAGQLASGASSAMDHGRGAAADGQPETLQSYMTGSLFRSTNPSAQPVSPDVERRAGTILAHAVKEGNLSAEDRSYLASMVAAQTGQSTQDAERRVDAVVAQLNQAEAKAKQAADDAKKAAAKFSIFMALAMAIGAFIASVGGALGGAHRDEWTAQLGTR